MAVVGVLAYLFGMLSSYLTSTLYHASTYEKRKETLRKFDHGAIYLHIAGTYMPFILILLWNDGAWGWALLSFISLAAIIGVTASFIHLKGHSNLETVCYVIMGCSIFVAFKPLYDALSLIGQTDSLLWLMGGGASYIIGALFYSWAKKKYMHTIFHLFVLGGSLCHMVAIYLIVK